MNDEAWRGVAAAAADDVHAGVSRRSRPSAAKFASPTTSEYLYAGGWFYDTDRRASASTRSIAIAGTATTRSRSTSTPSTTTRTRSGSASRRPACASTQLVSDDGEHAQRQLGRLLDGEDHDHRRRLVRRGANSLLDHRLSGGCRGTRGHGADGHAARLAPRRARDVSGHRSEVPVPPAIVGAGRRAARRDAAAKPFYLTPYVLAGGADTPFTGTRRRREIGVDVRYPFYAAISRST